MAIAILRSVTGCVLGCLQDPAPTYDICVARCWGENSAGLSAVAAVFADIEARPPAFAVDPVSLEELADWIEHIEWLRETRAEPDELVASLWAFFEGTQWDDGALRMCVVDLYFVAVVTELAFGPEGQRARRPELLYDLVTEIAYDSETMTRASVVGRAGVLAVALRLAPAEAAPGLLGLVVDHNVVDEVDAFGHLLDRNGTSVPECGSHAEPESGAEHCKPGRRRSPR